MNRVGWACGSFAHEWQETFASSQLPRLDGTLAGDRDTLASCWFGLIQGPESGVLRHEGSGSGLERVGSQIVERRETQPVFICRPPTSFGVRCDGQRCIVFRIRIDGNQLGTISSDEEKEISMLDM